MASSYDVLGDAAEYQEWLASQTPPAAPIAESEQSDAKQQAQEIGDLPADIAQIVVHMEQQHAAAVLSAYQSLQRSRQNAPPAPSDAVYDTTLQEPSGVMADTIATSSEVGRSSRSMAKWEAQQAVWARQQSSISRKMHRPVPELAMSTVRAAEWRDKKELITTLEAAIPWTQRGAGGADIWPLQLRDNWTRHVPLGNLFSGLFVEIKEKTNAEQAAQLVSICRPELLEPHLFPASAPGGLPITAGGHPSRKAKRRSWASSEYLAQRLEKFSGYLKETQPHKPEAVAVTGNPVGPSQFSEDITLNDVAASLRLEQGEVAAALIKARDTLQEQARLQQQKETKQVAAAAAAEAAEKGKPKGPHLELSGQRLLFECASGITTCTSLALSNTGSTALHYRWERIQPHTHRRQTSMLFYMPDQHGAVLPNALHTFCFQFSPTANGMYTETWVLHTHPSTPQGPHHVTLRGAAIGPNVLGRERRKVCAMLAEKEKSAKVEGALERILADVKPPPHAMPVWSEVQQHQEAAFNTANAAAQPAVYFSPDVYHDLAQLYHTLQGRLAASAPPPVDPKKAKGSKAPPVLPAPVFPEQWDASLDTFPAALQQLANQDAAAAEGVRQKFEEAKQAVLVPQHSHVLHWHAIRLLLQQAVDQMDTTADTVKQACIEKEQQRAAATAPVQPKPKGGKAAAAAAPAPPAYNSAEFKHELTVPVQQLLKDTLDQVVAAVQSEEHSVAKSLQQRLVHAQEKLQKQPKEASQEAWDVFALMRSEARLALVREPTKAKGHGPAVAS
ncbi:hypothetical protein WJX77_000174 [Trebouxia sp. C0004]